MFFFKDLDLLGLIWVYLFFFISQNNWNHNDVPARETGQGMSSGMIRQAVHLPTDYPDFLNIPKNVGTNPSEHKKKTVCAQCSLFVVLALQLSVWIIFLCCF